MKLSPLFFLHGALLQREAQVGTPKSQDISLPEEFRYRELQARSIFPLPHPFLDLFSQLNLRKDIYL